MYAFLHVFTRHCLVNDSIKLIWSSVIQIPHEKICMEYECDTEKTLRFITIILSISVAKALFMKKGNFTLEAKNVINDFYMIECRKDWIFSCFAKFLAISFQICINPIHPGEWLNRPPPPYKWRLQTNGKRCLPIAMWLFLKFY